MAANDRISGLVGNAAIKVPCRVASTTNITLSGLQAVDSVSVVANDRVLVKDQTSSIDNGIYVASTGSWTRSADCDGNRDLVKGTQVYVLEGVNGIGYWRCTTADEVIVGTSAITWTQTEGRDALVGLGFESRYDIRNYGAVESATDNSTAIQAAIDACIAAGGGYVYIPVGRWKITTGLVVDDAVTPTTPYNVFIQGEGNENFSTTQGSTIDISGIAAGGIGITFGVSGDTRRPTGCGLRCLKIDGVNSSVVGVKSYGSTFERWDDVYVHQCGYQGVWFAGEHAEGYFRNLQVHTAGDITGRAALQMDSPTVGLNTTNMWFIQTQVHNFEGDGILMDATAEAGGIQACWFTQTKVHYTGEATPPATKGIHLKGINICGFSQMWCVGAGHEVLYLDDGCTDIRFIDCAFTQANLLAAGKYTVHLADADDTIFDTCLFTANTAGDLFVDNASPRTTVTGTCRFANPTPLITDETDSGFGVQVHYPAVTNDPDRSLNFVPMRLTFVDDVNVSLSSGGHQSIAVDFHGGALTGIEMYVVGADVELDGCLVSAQYVASGNARINIHKPTTDSFTSTAVNFKVGCIVPQPSTVAST